MAEITDPKLLAQLGAPTEVTDPHLLAQLEGQASQPSSVSGVDGIPVFGTGTAPVASTDGANGSSLLEDFARGRGLSDQMTTLLGGEHSPLTAAGNLVSDAFSGLNAGQNALYRGLDSISGSARLGTQLGDILDSMPGVEGGLHTPEGVGDYLKTKYGKVAEEAAPVEQTIHRGDYGSGGVEDEGNIAPQTAAQAKTAQEIHDLPEGATDVTYDPTTGALIGYTDKNGKLVVNIEGDHPALPPEDAAIAKANDEWEKAKDDFKAARASGASSEEIAGHLNNIDEKYDALLKAHGSEPLDRTIPQVEDTPPEAPVREGSPVHDQQAALEQALSSDWTPAETPLSRREQILNATKQLTDNAEPGKTNVVQPFPEGEPDYHRFLYTTPDGKNVSGFYTFDPETGKVENLSIGESALKNQVGPSGVRSILRSIQEQHPDLTGVEGYRISGARKAAGNAAEDVGVSVGSNAGALPPSSGGTGNALARLSNEPAVGGAGGGQPPEPPSNLPALPEEGPRPNNGTEGPQPGGPRDNVNQDRFDYNTNNRATEEEVRGAFDHFGKTLRPGYQSNDSVTNDALHVLRNNDMHTIITSDPPTSQASAWGLAKRVVGLASSNRAIEAAKAFVLDPSEENWGALNRWRVTAGAAYEGMSKHANFVGRALNQFNIMAGSRGMAEAYAGLDRMMSGRTGPINRGEFAQTLIDTARTAPDNVPDLMRNSVKPYFEDYIMSYWYRMALSNPKTWLTTAFDNSQKLFESLAVHSLAPGVSKAETVARWAGLQQAVKDVSTLLSKTPAKDWQNIRTAFEQAHPVTGASAHAPPGVRFSPENPTTALGKVGKFADSATNIGPKSISAVDQLFRGVTANIELYGLSVRKAISEGLKPDTPEFAQRVADIRLNPTKQMVDTINQRARSAQYAEALPTALGGFINKITLRQANMTGLDRATRFAAFIAAPFPRVEGNIIRNFLRNNAFTAILSDTNRKAWKAGGAERSAMLTRVTLGTTMAGLIAGYATDQNSAVHITGSGPSDYRKRQNMPQGWQPNSLYFHGKYYSLGNTYFGTASAAIASAMEGFRNNEIDHKELGSRILGATGGLINAVENSTWFKDGSEFLDLFKPGPDGDLAREKFIPNKAASFVVPAGLSAVNQSFVDKDVRSLKAPTLGGRIENTIESRIPGKSQNLPQQHDVYGDPLTRNKDFLTGTTITQSGDNVVHDEMSRLAQAVGKPLLTEAPSKVKFQRKELQFTPQQTQDFQAKSGQYLTENFTNFMNSPMYGKLTDEQRANVLKHMESFAKRRAKIEVIHGK